MVWFWLFPLLFVLWPISPGAGKKPRAFLHGYLTGLAFFIPNLFWIRHSSRVYGGARTDDWIGLGPELMGIGAVVGLSAYCALYFGLWAWFTHRFAKPNPHTLSDSPWQISTLHSLRSAFLAAGAWVACEWLRSTTVFTGFGWNGLSVALHENLVLIQAADLVGVMGLSFLPVFIACTAWNLITRLTRVYRGEGSCRARLDFTFAMVLLLSAAGYGMVKLAEVRTDDVKVRTLLIQPDVAQVDAWTGELGPQIYRKLSDWTRLNAETREGKSQTDLVIWPESALPVHLYGLPEHKDYFDDLLSCGEFSLLTGTEIREGENSHVSAVLFKGSYEQRQIYHKMHLVPFGEFLPFRDIPPFSLLQGVLPGDFQPGLKAEPLKLAQPEVEIIPLICFEDTVGRLARHFARPAPQMIVNITNDGWFLQSEETEVHLANALFRAIELRRPMVRAANTGITCFIDTHGRVTSRLEDPESGNTFIEGFLPGEVSVPRAPEMTLYARFGDWFALLMLGLCVLSAAFKAWAPGPNRLPPVPSEH